MHSRRLVKRSVIGSRVYAPGLTGDAATLTGVIQAVKQDNRDAAAGHRRNVYTVLMQDGSLKEYTEEEIAQMTAKAPLKSSLKVRLCGQLGLLLLLFEAVHASLSNTNAQHCLQCMVRLFVSWHGLCAQFERYCV